MAFYEEMRAWEAEVDAEAARLVREGTPPFDAIEQARQIVIARRRRAADNARKLDDPAVSR